MTAFVLGAAQTDFAENATKMGKTLKGLMHEATQAALDDARLSPGDIDAVHVANFGAALYDEQAHLGAYAMHALGDGRPRPATRHEAACASGSVAVLAAMADVMSGRCDTALVVGVEHMRRQGGFIAQDRLRGAGDRHGDLAEARFPWAAVFDEVAGLYEERHGLDRAHLVALAESNFQNAKRNPLAQTRSWTLGAKSFTDDDENNPIVAGRLRRHDCSQVTDGAAAVIVTSARGRHRVRDDSARAVSVITGAGHRTGGMRLSDNIGPSGGVLVPHVRAAVAAALAEAGVPDAWGLDLIETHDCFTPSFYLAIDHFGLCAPGKAGPVVESGALFAGGRLPMNPSGGLMGLGHPVGATGVRMVSDLHRQVTGRAGDIQVPGARRAGLLNIGGALATAVGMVVEAAPRE